MIEISKATPEMLDQLVAEMRGPLIDGIRPVTAPIRPSALLAVADRLIELDDHSGRLAGGH
jgi:hypothetical protein